MKWSVLHEFLAAFTCGDDPGIKRLTLSPALYDLLLTQMPPLVEEHREANYGFQRHPFIVFEGRLIFRDDE